MNAASLLVVDDDPLAARYMTLALSENFADIRCAANGVDAPRRRPGCPTVLSDLRMPSMDGHRLLAHLKER
jgi:CheY-like chemotaxis protein